MFNFIKVISCLSLFLFANILNAVPERISNYEQQLITAVAQARIKPLSELAKYYSSENPQKSLQLGQEALSLLKQYPDSYRQIFVYHYLVMAYLSLAEYDRVELLLPIYTEFTKKHGDFDEIAMSKKDAAYLYLRRDSNYSLAIEYFHDALVDYRKMPSDTENINFAIGGTLNDIGLMHYYNDRFEQALDYYLQALAIDGYEESIYSIRSLGNIALIHKQYKRYQQALGYYYRALANAREYKRPSRIIEQLINLSATYILTGNYALAQQYLTEAATLQPSTGKKRSAYRIAKYFGDIYRHQSDYLLATKYYQEALSHAHEMQTPRYVAETEIALGKMYVQLKQYQQALLFFKQALDTAKKLEFESLIIQSHKLLADTYQQLADYRWAYQHIIEYQKLNEQRFEQTRSEKLVELEEQYKAEQRETEITLLTKDKELESLKFQRQRYIGFAIFVIVLLLTGFLIYRQSQKRKLAHQKAQMMADMIDKKNQLLADVSHELRTPLTVLQLKVEALQHNLVQDVEASYDSLMTKISDINHLISDIYQLAQSDIGALHIELASHNASKLLSQWTDEFSNVIASKNLSWQEKITIPNALEIQFDSNKIKQVLSNLLDNSTTYTDTPGTVTLSVFVNKQFLVFKLEDSAPGIEPEYMNRIFERLFRVENSRSRATGGSGLGLAICRSIIDAHKGTITASNSKLGGLAITIQLPLIQE